MRVWQGERPRTPRTVLARRGLAAQGMNFSFVSERIATPTDWCFSEGHHVLVVHRDGRLKSMESEFSSGPTGRILPRVGDVWVIPADHRYAALATGDTVGFCEIAFPATALPSRQLTPRIGKLDPFLHRLTDRLAGLADRDDAMTFGESHGFHVHLRVLPDLRVDEAGKEQAEEAFGQAFCRKGRVAQHRLANLVLAPLVLSVVDQGAFMPCHRVHPVCEASGRHRRVMQRNDDRVLRGGNLLLSRIRRIFLIVSALPMRGSFHEGGADFVRFNMMLKSFFRVFGHRDVLATSSLGAAIPLFAFVTEAQTKGVGTAAHLMVTDPFHIASLGIPSTACRIAPATGRTGV